MGHSVRTTLPLLTLQVLYTGSLSQFGVLSVLLFHLVGFANLTLLHEVFDLQIGCISGLLKSLQLVLGLLVEARSQLIRVTNLVLLKEIFKLAGLVLQLVPTEIGVSIDAIILHSVE